MEEIEQFTPRISSDGSTVVFHSKANNFVSYPPDDNGVEDVFIYDVRNRSRSVFNPLHWKMVMG